MDNKTIDSYQLRKIIWKHIYADGNKKTFCEKWRLNKAHFIDMINGKQNISARQAWAVGYKKIGTHEFEKVNRYDIDDKSVEKLYTAYSTVFKQPATCWDVLSEDGRQKWRAVLEAFTAFER